MCGNYESVQIEFPKNGERKIIVDGKELDLSKLISFSVTVEAGKIDIDVIVPKQGLPYKE